MTNTARARRRFGTILVRKLPTGVAVYRARWTEGRTGPRRERVFRSRKEAAAFLTGIEKTVMLGEYRPPPTQGEVLKDTPKPLEALPSFSAYAADVLDRVIAPTRATATVVLYRANLRALRRYFGRRRTKAGVIPAVPMDGISHAAFLEYRAWRKGHPTTGPKDRKVSSATLNKDQQFARLVLNLAVAEGLLGRNPLSGLKELSEPRRVRRWLSDEEAERLLAACDENYRPFVLASLLTGCRGVELRALRWADVHFDIGKLDILRGKTGTPDALDLHPTLSAALLAMKASRPSAHDRDRVFLNCNGEPWKDMRRAWRRAVKKAGFDGREGLTPHSLRHTHATRFLQGGGSPRDLQSQLGHADLRTTIIYSDLVDERRKKSILSLPFGSGKKGDNPDAQGGAQGGCMHPEGSVEDPPGVYEVA